MVSRLHFQHLKNWGPHTSVPIRVRSRTIASVLPRRRSHADRMVSPVRGEHRKLHDLSWHGCDTRTTVERAAADRKVSHARLMAVTQGAMSKRKIPKARSRSRLPTACLRTCHHSDTSRNKTRVTECFRIIGKRASKANRFAFCSSVKAEPLARKRNNASVSQETTNPRSDSGKPPGQMESPHTTKPPHKAPA